MTPQARGAKAPCAMAGSGWVCFALNQTRSILLPVPLSVKPVVFDMHLKSGVHLCATDFVCGVAVQ